MTTSLATYWRRIASGTNESLTGKLLVMLLVPFSILYALILSARSGLYRTGILNCRQLPRPVVSIGNITVGGTGKTPVTAYIARFLMERGVKVAVLSRGYGGSLEGQTSIVSDGVTVRLRPDECGDEPFLLARTIPGLMVIIGADRYQAGLLALNQLSPDILLLDDGFQHLRLQRDLDIVLLDYSRPFGNGWTLPGGLLREPRRAVERADMVLYTRCPDGLAPPPKTPGKIVCNARHQLSAVRPYAGEGELPLSSLKGRKILAFAGIAEPLSFFDGLSAHGLNIAATISFPDHVAYTEPRIAEIVSALRVSGADCMITTEKDGVKLSHLPAGVDEKIFLAPLHLALDDPSLLTAALMNLLQK